MYLSFNFNSFFTKYISFTRTDLPSFGLLTPRLQWRHHLTFKVKCTLVQALRLCTGRTAYRGSRGIALPFHDHGTRRGWGVSVTPQPFFTPGKDPVPIVQEAGWAPGPAWTGAESLAPTGIRSPDRPASSQSLYRLSYRAYSNIQGLKLNHCVINNIGCTLKWASKSTTNISMGYLKYNIFLLPNVENFYGSL